MSGHSKWSNIKFRKERQDTKRSNIFSKLARDIFVAVKLGGADENANPRLRIALQAAKKFNLPNENIERAIKKGLGQLAGEMQEFTIEGYGPNGVAILIEVSTDNRQRAISAIRGIFNKFGCKITETGGVKWMFKKIGQITLSPNQEKNKEDLEILIIDSGAEDYKEDNERIIIRTKSNELNFVKTKLEKENIKIDNVELIYIPKDPLPMANSEKVQNFVNELENLEDVSAIYLNSL